MTLIATAKNYLGLSLSVMGINESKKPVHQWKKYQTERANINDIPHLFGNASKIGVACGVASGNLEVIDIDDATLFDDFYNKIHEHFGFRTDKILLSKTNKGYHLYYRNQFDMSQPHDDISNCGNQVLARRKKDENGTILPRIETRGQGGYVVAPPSEGYTFMNGGSFDNIPSWSVADRQVIFAIARTYDLHIETASNIPQEKATYEYQNTPWDEYNRDESYPWINILTDKGWKVIDTPDKERIYFLRPGDADSEQSANYHISKGVFWVWSTSTELQSGRGYTPALLRCQLLHGDINADTLKINTGEIIAEGYGTRRDNRQKGVINKAAKIISANEGLSDAQLMALMRVDINKMHLVGEEDLLPIAKEKAKEIIKKEKVESPNERISLISSFLEERGIRRNQVLQSLEDSEGNTLKEEEVNDAFLEIYGNKPITEAIFYKVCKSTKFIENVHPLREFFDDLQPKDSEDSIRDLFESLTIRIDDDKRDIMFGLFKKYLLQFMASAYHVGPLDLMLVLTGGKNLGKTYFLSHLLPKPLEKYKAVIQDFKQNDLETQLMLGTRLLVVRDDIEGTGTKDFNWLKSTLSLEIATFKAPYAKGVDDHRRYAVFGATSNDMGLLSSDPNNRRIIPMHVVGINHEKYNSVVCDENYSLWAELKNIWESGKDKRKLFAVSKEEMRFLSNLAEFKALDPCQEAINRLFGPSKKGEDGLYKIANEGGGDKYVEESEAYMTYADICNHLSVHAKYIQQDHRKIGSALRELGYDKKRVRIKGNNTKSMVYFMYRRKVDSAIDVEEASAHRATDDLKEEIPF